MSYKFRKAEKQVCFEDFDKNHADLKIRLHYDGLRQNEFFRLMMRKYINKDENMILKFICGIIWLHPNSR